MKGIAFLLAVFFALCPVAGQAVFADGQGGEKDFSRSGLRLNIFSDSEMDFQLLRSFGADTGGGGAPGERAAGADLHMGPKLARGGECAGGAHHVQRRGQHAAGEPAPL